VAWGDYDNDGRLDIFLSGCASGNCATGIFSKLYHNTGTGFVDASGIVQGGCPKFTAAAWPGGTMTMTVGWTSCSTG